VAAAVEVRRGWCSSRGGWKMRAGIGAGDGGGAHSAFYRAKDEGAEEVGAGTRPAASAISMADILENEAGAT
jgi:hypothetical protein